MADLEAAADTALAKVKELEGEIAEAQAALSALKEEMARVLAQVAEDAAALADKAQSLFELAQAEADSLAEDAIAAVAALDQAAGAIESARSDSEESIAGARERVASFAEQVEQARPQAQGLVEQGRSALEALGQQAAQAQPAVEQSAAQAREAIDTQMAAGVQALQERIEQQAGEAERVIGEELPASIDEAFAGWEAKLAELESFLEDFFGEARAHVEEVVTYCLEECARGHMDALDALTEQVGGTLLPALQKLQGTVGDGGQEVDMTSDALGEALMPTGEEIESAIGALESVTQTLASYSFVNV